MAENVGVPNFMSIAIIAPCRRSSQEGTLRSWRRVQPGTGIDRSDFVSSVSKHRTNSVFLTEAGRFGNPQSVPRARRATSEGRHLVADMRRTNHSFTRAW